MTDVVGAPDNDVVPDPDIRLDDVCLEDEAVVTDLDVFRDKRLRADVADQLVTAALALRVNVGPSAVHSAEADRNEHRTLRRRVRLLETLERHDRNAEEIPAVDVSLARRKCDAVMRTAVAEIGVS